MGNSLGILSIICGTYCVLPLVAFGLGMFVVKRGLRFRSPITTVEDRPNTIPALRNRAAPPRSDAIGYGQKPNN